MSEPKGLDIPDPTTGDTGPTARDRLKAKSKRATGLTDKLRHNLSLMQESTAPRLAEFIEAVVQEMGGPQKCAKEWAAEFKAAKPGSNQKYRMLDQLAKMMGIYGDMTGEHGSVDEMDDDELLAVAGQLELGGEDYDDE